MKMKPKARLLKLMQKRYDVKIAEYGDNPNAYGLGQLIDHLKDEAKELDKAYYGISNRWTEKVESEIADVASLAIMTWNKLQQIKRDAGK